MIMADLHKLPISDRPPRPWSRTIYATLFFVLYNAGALMINATQFLFVLPLKLLPFKWANGLYEEGIRYTKGAFGCLLILMVQWFAPTKLSITFEREGLGKFTEEEIQNIANKNEKGEIISLNLPQKIVFIGNHQVYVDWWYAWCLLYFIGPNGVHRDIYITLKKSLKWLPIVGWGMQFFNFIFLARSWASDRRQLASSLSSLAKKTEQQDRPFAFFLYPEGTLVSKDTRPISKKFADKLGIDDMVHSLLPRSTGLHYSLRSLAPRIPDLKVLCATIVYPGIPPLKYGQSYYTLRSIFFDGVAPPEIHVHLRKFDVSRDIPLGKSIEGANPATIPSFNSAESVVEVDIPDSEKTVFDDFLRGLWREQDHSIDNFLKKGTFSESHGPKPDVEIPLRLRRVRDIFDAFCFFVPAAAGYVWSRIS